MTIREMQAGDLERIGEITKFAWGEMTLHRLMEDRHGMIGKRGWAERKVESVRAFCERNPSRTIVAVEDDQVVGYATFKINKEDGVGEVGDNAVDPAFRGRGIGTAMNKRIMELFETEGLRVACVSTLAHDLAAQKVYAKHGFQEIARTIHYTRALR